METVDTVKAKLLQDLRRLAPHSVRVFDSSDEYRDVAVPSRRKRWTQVIETIEARPWVRCELRDKRGQVLGYVETELERVQDDAPMSTSIPAEAAQMRWFLDIMLRAQHQALTFVNKEHAVVLGSIREILEVQTSAMRETVELLKQQRDVSTEIAEQRAAAAAQGDDGLEQILKIVEQSPKLMEKIGPMFAMLMAPKRIAARVQPAAAAGPSSPPNGKPPAPNGKPGKP